jgi:Xaa-Pro aminopeptidase
MTGLQSFTATAAPADGPPRLAALRKTLAAQGLDGFIVPRADAHQGEYVAARDERLSWLAGFTGSAGFCIVLPHIAGVFIDGRYRVQARAECDPTAFTLVHWPEVKPGAWLVKHAGNNAVIGYDAWLHTPSEIARLTAELSGSGITLQALSINPVDAIWPDQPEPPLGQVWDHPAALSGTTCLQKRTEIAAACVAKGAKSVLITLPDSLCWLLNIRGSDAPRTPIAHGFAVLHHDASVDLFIDPRKLAGISLDPAITVRAPDTLVGALATAEAPVWADPVSAPARLFCAMSDANVKVIEATDPCQLPKACKTDAEIAGTRAAHLRDGAAMVEFLCWLDSQAALLVANPAHRLTEIDIVRQLEACRAATGLLHDLSFDTISGSGPHGAIVHYRVTEATNRQLCPGDLMLVDSGAQYRDGTTDITRTIAIGAVGPTERSCFTRVLQGMIAMSRARFPKGVTGAHLDALARMPLWLAGQDYDHGTGHGVGAFLSVHEGPQRLSRLSEVPLYPGMIVSNEPGYYREGAFGIRIENLIVVQPAPTLDGGDARDMLSFETLTLAPIDRRLIETDLLSTAERKWINAYHCDVFKNLAPLVSDSAQKWLSAATVEI